MYSVLEYILNRSKGKFLSECNEFKIEVTRLCVLKTINWAKQVYIQLILIKWHQLIMCKKNEKNEKWKMFLIFKKKMKHFKKSNYSPEMNFNTVSLLKAMFANYESSREMRMLKFFFDLKRCIWCLVINWEILELYQSANWKDDYPRKLLD